MGGRSMPVDCPHGAIADWGGFGDDWEPYMGLCPKCVPPETVGPLTAEYRDWNRAWLEEHHRDWYAQRDAEGEKP
jgi:hypothetical protein